MIGIYKIKSPSSRIYIGQSINLIKREKDYFYKKCKGQIRLLKSINKYGWNAHNFEIIEECTLENLNERERYWQDYYNVLGPKGLNCKLTQTNDKSGVLSDIIKNNIKNTLLGNKHSEQWKLNQSKGQKGKKRSDTHKKSLSKATKERFKDPLKRAKQGLKLKKPVLQFSLEGIFIKEWESTIEIEKALNIKRSIISRCCNKIGYYKTAGGFIWKYKAIEEALKLIK